MELSGRLARRSTPTLFDHKFRASRNRNNMRPEGLIERHKALVDSLELASCSLHLIREVDYDCRFALLPLCSSWVIEQIDQTH